ncbi:MAG: hypothetical protein WBB67_10635 [bacterium]
MGILDKLRKGKKSESVLDSLIKKKEPDKAKDATIEKSDDIEVRELNPADAENIAMPEDIGMEPIEEDVKPTREFRTEGMHEFTLDSLGNTPSEKMKAEYKARVSRLIVEDKIDEAISSLQELKRKLAEQK